MAAKAKTVIQQYDIATLDFSFIVGNLEPEKS